MLVKGSEYFRVGRSKAFLREVLNCERELQCLIHVRQEALSIQGEPEQRRHTKTSVNSSVVQITRKKVQFFVRLSLVTSSNSMVRAGSGDGGGGVVVIVVGVLLLLLLVVVVGSAVVVVVFESNTLNGACCGTFCHYGTFCH